MSSIDRIKEWEATLPPQLREKIQSLVDQITEQMDVISQREGIVDKLIQEFLRLCDEIGLPPEQTSVFIKYKLKGIFSDDTIERHLPKDRKRKYNRYQETEIRTEEIPKKELLVESSTGIEESDESVPPNEEIMETAIDMSMAAAKISDDKVKELTKLLDQKQDELDKLQLQIAEFEFKLKDAIANVKENKRTEDKEVDSIIAEYENENKMLREALRKQVKTESFTPASEVQEPRTVWIAALNCFGLSRSLMQLSMKLTDESTKCKILFDIASDGSIKNPRLETSTLHEN